MIATSCSAGSEPNVLTEEPNVNGRELADPAGVADFIGDNTVWARELINRAVGVSENPPVCEGPNPAWLEEVVFADGGTDCLLYTSPSPRDKRQSRMPSSA